MIATTLIWAMSAAVGDASPIDPLINPSFEHGDRGPTGWRLSGGVGRWTADSAAKGKRAVSVTGTGTETNYWRTVDYGFAAGQFYRVRFSVQRSREAVGGLAIAGPIFANHDFRPPAGVWKQHSFVFVSPEDVATKFLRFGQWHVKGTLLFDDIQLVPVSPIHERVDGATLGQGERIDGATYTFTALLGAGNASRPLLRFSANFNAPRWVFARGSEVVYRHRVGAFRQKKGTVEVGVSYHTGGVCLVQASRDDRGWVSLGQINRVATDRFAIPPELLPAEMIYVRLKGAAAAKLGTDSDPGCFQVTAYRYTAELAGNPPSGEGSTQYVELHATDPRLSVSIDRIGTLLPGDENPIELTLTSNVDHPLSISAYAETAPDDDVDDQRQFRRGPVSRRKLSGKQIAKLKLAAPVSGTGSLRTHVRIHLGAAVLYQGGFTFHVPELYDVNYGHLLPASSDNVALWWTNATRKVPRQRPLPSEHGPAIQLSAARHDYEAAQLIVRPKEALRKLTASISDLLGPNDARIPSSQAEILRARYVRVHTPTDPTGTKGWWPDPLPPLGRGVDVAAGDNQPLWILVHVPTDATAGDYLANVQLEAEGWSAQVPLKLHVWDFMLPERSHVTSAFGFSAGNVSRYHQLKSEADRRTVINKYLQSFSAHRISPYDPTPLDPFPVTFHPKEKPPRAQIEWAAFDRAMARAIDEFHFNSFRLQIQGMGGGRSHNRQPPKLEGFTDPSPEYAAMFSSQVEQIASHLREKGWLDEAYVYWYDEPEPPDYEFVANGMQRLKQYAPGLQRMLTEQPEEPLYGSVDIWCPITPNYDHERAEQHRKAGEKFWWYVCTGPKAPYCTLFIDHPATELRVWLWQTWQRDIDGILIWHSNYWTSSAAFPETLQNPYEDPMSYVSGYGTPAGTKRHWGNGDGRFIYPPEPAAEGKADTILDGPVSSVRWEMLREGIEDYEYLYMLRQLLAEAGDRISPEMRRKAESLLIVPEGITKDMTTFTKDSRPIYEHRAKIAETIEQLTHHPPTTQPTTEPADS